MTRKNLALKKDILSEHQKLVVHVPLRSDVDQRFHCPLASVPIQKYCDDNNGRGYSRYDNMRWMHLVKYHGFDGDEILTNTRRLALLGRPRDGTPDSDQALHGSENHGSESISFLDSLVRSSCRSQKFRRL